MTIISVRNQLITKLLKDGVFNLDQDGPKIKIGKKCEDIRLALIERAFSSLESTIVEKFVEGDEIYWVLKEDVSTKDQNVVLSPYTAEAVGNIINQYREAMGIEGGEADKLRITESDIQSLVVICSKLLNDVEIEQDEGDDSDE